MGTLRETDQTTAGTPTPSAVAVLTVALGLWGLYWLLHGLVGVTWSFEAPDVSDAGVQTTLNRHRIDRLVHLVAAALVLWKGREIARALLPADDEGSRTVGLAGAAAACVGTGALVAGLAQLTALGVYPDSSPAFEELLPLASAVRWAATRFVLGALTMAAPRLLDHLRRGERT